MIQQDNAYFAGILSTLSMIHGLGSNPASDALYLQIIESNDVERLCSVARNLEALEKSGLVDRGYAISYADALPLEEKVSSSVFFAREKRIIIAATKGDPLARAVLLRDQEPFINTILRRKFGWFLSIGNRHLEHMDLKQEARYLMLVKLKDYDPDRPDASWRSFIELKIWQHLHNVIRQREGLVSVPVKEYFSNRANVLFMSKETVDEDGNDLYPEMPDEGWHEGMIEFTEKMEFAARLQSLMWFLPDREHFMLRIYFGFDGEPLTKTAIAADLGMSPNTVTAIIENGLQTLRGWIETGQTPKKSHKPDLKRLSRWK